MGERYYSIFPEYIKQFSDFFKEFDPYDHPVVARTRPSQETQIEVYEPLLGYSSYHGVSLRAPGELAYNHTLYWVQRSAAAGRKWIVSYDEQAADDRGVEPDVNGTAHAFTRKASLWGNIMAGGA